MLNIRFKFFNNCNLLCLINEKMKTRFHFLRLQMYDIFIKFRMTITAPNKFNY
ncbi:hypothetical protein BC643_4704 [Mangrovibacterium diazotrophicum]|uniref:Uncharacterized protein n=1 Tax=Mangrovibacterium diazotrophicum TaxID=1261403 RepID=A0A419VUM9_9BACT|nr:hypothetical protein BC643_4704 [Mangrovibacterium diazotrophicum]